MSCASCCQFVVLMKFIAYVFIVDHNGECDSEQDADNSPSCLKGTKNWWSIRSLFGTLLFLLAIRETIAMPTKPREYAADSGNTKVCFKCFKIIAQTVTLR